MTPAYSEYLISAEELYAALNSKEIVIIDTREPEDYKVEHIPGAVNIYDIFTYLATEEEGGYTAMRLHFASLFGNAGIGGSERVIIYEDAMDNGYGRSCRGWFILKHLGYKNMQVLHGGIQEWLRKGFPLSKEITARAPKEFTIHPDNSIIADRYEMQKALSDENVIILDVRDHAEWIGVSSSPYGPDFVPRKGRLPRAIWIEWYNMMKNVEGIPKFKTPSELKELFAGSGITEKSNVIIYCFKGARTSNVFICMKMAGIKNVKCYFAAWNEWARIPELPIEKGYPKK